MQAIWDQAKEVVKESMDPEGFQRWIAPLRLVEGEGDHLLLECPSGFFKDWVERHHREQLEKALRKVAGVDRPLKFLVQKRPDEPSPKEKRAVQMRFGDLSPSPLWQSGLNGDYTFDRFVVGPCNEFAYSAALEVARSQRTRYNPLLLLANVGLGKSHLSSAIGNHVVEHGPQQRVCYTTAEGFMTEMVKGLKNKHLESFKEKYRRQCDVLVIDGIEFLSGKAHTQIELSHTLDALTSARKRIVLTSNLPPKDIPEMEEILRSRITSGLVVDIKPPDLDTRCRILQHKSKQEGVELPEEVTDYLARRFTDNVRQLESGLIHLLAKASLLRRPVDLELAREVTRDLLRESALPSKPTIEQILDCVCHHFKIEREALLSRSRKKAVYYPRQVAMYLCRQHTDATLTSIGKAFKRDHASVIHSLAVIQKRCLADTTTRHQLAFLSQQILKDS
ncbi:MAG: chromosomal replication initiator protein DnaA [bacterium]